MKGNDLRKQWEQRFAEYETSGKSITAWCIGQSIRINQFYYWRKKLRTEHLENEQPVKWLSLKHESHQLDIAEDSIAVHLGQVTIEIKKGFDPQLLRQIIKVLQNV